MDRGFVTALSVGVITLILTAVAGSVYMVNKLDTLEKENERIKEQLEDKQSKETARDLFETINENNAVTTDEVVSETTETNTVADIIERNTRVTCNGVTYENNCGVTDEVFFCGPDIYGCMSPSDYAAMDVCNGKSWNTSQCSEGSTYVCPAQGDAFCENKAITDQLDYIDAQLDQIADTIENYSPPEDASSNDVVSEITQALEQKEAEEINKSERTSTSAGKTVTATTTNSDGTVSSESTTTSHSTSSGSTEAEKNKKE